MSSADLEKLKGLFTRFDRDQSGSIDASELGKLLEAFASGTGERVLAALSKLETARPDRVSWDEFRTWWSEVVNAQHAKPAPRKTGPVSRRRSAPAAVAADPDQSVRDLREIFQRFDRDKSGTMDARELGALLEALGKDPDDEELAAIFRRLDADKSGRISFDELQVWWEDEA